MTACRCSNRRRLTLRLPLPVRSRSDHSHPLSRNDTNWCGRFPIPAQPANDSLCTLGARDRSTVDLSGEERTGFQKRLGPAGISVQVELHNIGTQDTERTGDCTDLSLKRLSCHETRCSECPELTQPQVDQNFAKINRFVAKASIGPYKYRKPRIAASNPRLRYGVVRSQSR